MTGEARYAIVPDQLLDTLQELISSGMGGRSQLQLVASTPKPSEADLAAALVCVGCDAGWLPEMPRLQLWQYQFTGVPPAMLAELPPSLSAANVSAPNNGHASLQLLYIQLSRADVAWLILEVDGFIC